MSLAARATEDTAELVGVRHLVALNPTAGTGRGRGGWPLTGGVLAAHRATGAYRARLTGLGTASATLAGHLLGTTAATHPRGLRSHGLLLLGGLLGFLLYLLLAVLEDRLLETLNELHVLARVGEQGQVRDIGVDALERVEHALVLCSLRRGHS